MIKRPLGSTGLWVSPIGLGTVKFGRNSNVKYPTAFELPSDKEILTLLDVARDLGITLLDTAPAYGTSEERLGALLKEKRKEWIISTKVGEEYINGQSRFNFTEEHMLFSIERSLKRLRTDYLDLVLVHSDGKDVHNIKQLGVLDQLLYIKKQGLIRAIGMSTKTVEGGLLTVEKADVVMVTYNPVQVEEKAVITAAHQQNKGVLIKKALASGHINTLPGQDPVCEALNFIFQEPGVSSAILGTLNAKHLAHNVSCLKVK